MEQDPWVSPQSTNARAGDVMSADYMHECCIEFVRMACAG